MAISNLFKDFFYGKPGQRDFTEADLPETRLQLFRTVLKVRLGSMVSLNLIYLPCWLPAAIWTFINLVQLNHLASSAPSAQALASLAFTYLLILFPLIALTGPFTAGVSFVMRNWARDEHSYPFLDFKDALKANWKQALLLSAINGALPLVGYVCFTFYARLGESSPLFYLPLGLVLAAMVLWLLAAQLMPTMLVTYRLRFGALARNALLMTLAALPRALGVKLATLAVPLILLVLALVWPAALSVAYPAALAACAIVGLSFNKLIVASYSNALCEKYLNSKIEGARVNIGLRGKDEASHDERAL